MPSLRRLEEKHFVKPGPLWWGFDWESADRHAQEFTGAAPRVVPNGVSPTNGRVVLIDSIPRRRHRAWGAGLHVITDLSRRLIPYRVDQGVLCRTLQRLLSKTDATFASLRDNDLLPLTHWPREARGRWHVPPDGATVLVLGDLGALHAPASDARRRWRELGERLATAGVRRVALIPCLPHEVPVDLQQWWSLVPWERTRAEGGRNERRAVGAIGRSPEETANKRVESDRRPEKLRSARPLRPRPKRGRSRGRAGPANSVPTSLARGPNSNSSR